MTEQVVVREEVARYEVCAMPAGAMDAEQFTIRAVRLPDGSWEVHHRGDTYQGGAAFHTPAGRYTRDEALRVARELAVQVRVGGMTAAEYQAWAPERVVGRG